MEANQSKCDGYWFGILTGMLGSPGIHHVLMHERCVGQAERPCRELLKLLLFCQCADHELIVICETEGTGYQLLGGRLLVRKAIG